MNTPIPRPPRLRDSRRAAQIVVWAAAAVMAVFIAVAGPTFSHGASSNEAPFAARGAHTSAATGTPAMPVFASDEVVEPDVSDLDGGAPPVGRWSTIQNEWDNLSDEDWLPAYRWMYSFNLGFQNDDGWFSINAGLQLSTYISSFFFDVSAFLWSILLELTQRAFRLDVVDNVGAQINGTAANLADSLGSGGVIAIVVLLLLISVANAVVFGNRGSGGVQTAMRNVVLFLVPLAALQLMSANADPISEPTKYKYQTPVGLASTASTTIDDTVATITSPLMTSSLNEHNNRARENDGNTPSCDWYYARLYATYFALSEDGSGSPVVSDAESERIQNLRKSQTALALVSRMWEATMLHSFTQAQYGLVSEGKYAVCHQLEYEANIDPRSQAEISKGAGSPYEGWALKTDSEDAANIYGTPDDAQKRAAYFFAFMACRNGDASAWPNADEGDGKDGDRLEDADCTEWKTKGFDWDEGRFSQAGSAEDALIFGTDGDDSPAQKLGGSTTDEYKVVYSYQSGTGRLGLSLASMITAGVYLVAMGGLAVGVITASLILVLLLLFLPVTLLLLALPSKDGRRNSLGVRMLKMTGSTLLAKFTFYLSLIVVTIAINVLNGLVV